MKDQKRTLAETNSIRLVERDGWSYVERVNASGVVCIVACTDEGKIVLIEQYRPPVGRNVIELHEVPLAEVNQWLVRAQAAGRLVDGRVYAGLHFLSQERPNGE